MVTFLVNAGWKVDASPHQCNPDAISAVIAGRRLHAVPLLNPGGCCPALHPYRFSLILLPRCWSICCRCFPAHTLLFIIIAREGRGGMGVADSEENSSHGLEYTPVGDFLQFGWRMMPPPVCSYPQLFPSLFMRLNTVMLLQSESAVQCAEPIVYLPSRGVSVIHHTMRQNPDSFWNRLSYLWICTPSRSQRRASVLLGLQVHIQPGHQLTRRYVILSPIHWRQWF